MDVPIERRLVESAIHILELKGQTETISIEKEYILGLVDRLRVELERSDGETSSISSDTEQRSL